MMKTSKRISISFVLSVGVHALLALLLFLQPQNTLKNLMEKEQPVEVELVDAEKMLEQMKRMQSVPTPKGQIVEQEKQLNDEIDKNARFLSKHNQKVIQETQAALNGKFKNTDGTSGETKPEKKIGKVEESVAETDKETKEQAEKSADEEKPTDKLTSPDGIVAGGKKPSLKDLTPSFKPGVPRVDTEEIAQGGGEGPSATDDHLKNVRTGMQTLLSTREFVYYAYYNRIKDKLRQYWEPKIKEKMERIVRQGRTIASNTERITKIVIILDERGTLQRVQIIGPSGVRDLDEAAVEAFRAAAPFPNPPKGIVEADGTIKIRWDFILEANAADLLDVINQGVKRM